MYASVNGWRLLRWYEMGITDPEDLAWLIEFYRGDVYKPNLAMAALTATRDYENKLLTK